MISLDSLSFGYTADEPIIEDLTWEFPPGSTTAITGVSGRGKSTLLYLIGLLLTPWSGAILTDGRDLSSMGDAGRSRWRASRVGFVFQDAALDPTRTILDNVIESSVYNRAPRRSSITRAGELMGRFGVGLRADHKPGEVSGGQAQRIALCRALLSDPDLILADEPTGNLDAGSAQVVIDTLLQSAAGGKTVIVGTHDETIVCQCDEVLAL